MSLNTKAANSNPTEVAAMEIPMGTPNSSREVVDESWDKLWNHRNRIGNIANRNGCRTGTLLMIAPLFLNNNFT